MSGPKCVDIYVEPRSVQRERNRSQCKNLGAEYARLELQYQKITDEMARVGLSAPGITHATDIQQHVTDLLNDDRDIDAASYLNREVGRLREGVNDCQSKLHSLIVELQRRFRELANNRKLIEQERSMLLVHTPKSLPSYWPDSEKSRLSTILEQIIGTIATPAELEAQFDVNAIAKLKAAETVAATSAQAIVESRARMEREINDTHARILTDKLVAHSGPVQSLSDVLQSLLVTPKLVLENDLTESKLDGLLAHIIVLKDTGGWNSLMERTGEIRRETDVARRKMLYDDLVIQCSRRLTHLRELARWQADIDQLIDGVTHLAGEAAVVSLVKDLEEIKRSGQVAKLDAIRLRVRQTVENLESHLERERKRQAILQSLHELGYETSEGMETAFVRGGKLVIRKPNDNEYAVEIASNDNLSLFQTAMMRYADSHETSEQQRLRDTAVEETWCSEHASFLNALAKRGFTTTFKMKHNAGAIPMHVVIDKSKVEARRRAAAIRNTRSQTASQDGSS